MTQPSHPLAPESPTLRADAAAFLAADAAAFLAADAAAFLAADDALRTTTAAGAEPEVPGA